MVGSSRLYQFAEDVVIALFLSQSLFFLLKKAADFFGEKKWLRFFFLFSSLPIPQRIDKAENFPPSIKT